jgi:hypothetical protein
MIYLGVAGLVLAVLFYRWLEWRLRTMADNFTADVTRLEADVTAYTNLITSVAANTTANTEEIISLKAQIAALPPTVDTAALEASLAILEGNNTALAATLPAPAPVPTPTPTV